MGEGTVREFGTATYTLLYLKWIINKDLLFNTRNSAQWYVAAWMGGEFGGKWIHVYVWLYHPCSPEIITTLLISYTSIPKKKVFSKKKKKLSTASLLLTH